LVAVLKEVKYLLIYEVDNIPPNAATIFEKNETFIKFVTNLDLIVLEYNKVRRTVLEVEYPIIEGQLVNIDTQLEKAENQLNWTDESKTPPPTPPHIYSTYLFYISIPHIYSTYSITPALYLLNFL